MQLENSDSQFKLKSLAIYNVVERSGQFYRHVDGRNWRRVDQQQQGHQTDIGREEKEHWWLQVSFFYR